MATNQEKILKENGGYKFKFSLIMAVYNVADYLKEALDSVINQSIGFSDNVQVILCDDGSPDSSGELCDKYKEMYPDNIVVIHKENGGPGSARNAGIPLAEGRYVCFMDPDDSISKNTLKDVYNFFSKNDEKVNMVSIPVFHFESVTGPHHLNTKFEQGTRIINLLEEDNVIQYFVNSAFIKNSVIQNYRFDDNLRVVAEDAQLCCRMLIDNPMLGVCAKGCYNYRRREDSLVSTSALKKGWYIDYLKHFSYLICEYAEKKYGHVPRFIQNMVFGDIRWKFSKNESPDTILEPHEIDEYKTLLYGILRFFDDDIISRLNILTPETKYHILTVKHGRDEIKFENNDVIYYGSCLKHTFSNNDCQPCFIDFEGEDLVLTVRLGVLDIHKDDVEESYIMLGNQKIVAEYLGQELKKASIGTPVSYWLFYRYRFSKALACKAKSIYFYAKIKGIDIQCKNILPSPTFITGTLYKKAYCRTNGLIFRLKNDRLTVEKSNIFKRIYRELAFLTELAFSRNVGSKKAFFGRLCTDVYKLFHRKPVWVLMDRVNKGGDNAEAVLEYLVNTNFKKARFFYAISDSADYHRLKKKYGKRVVLYGNFRYKLKFLTVNTILSSHADQFVQNPFGYYIDPYRDILNTQRFVFLQHGITKNDISGWLNRFNKNIRGFVCAAEREKDSIVNGKSYYYDDDRVWLTGFARFDRLYNNERGYITIMPTWRKYLVTRTRSDEPWKCIKGFKQSDYFKFYNALLNDERLIETAKKHGYTICFMPHPNIIGNIGDFDKHKDVKFFSISKEYREMYAESNLILTDYSSAMFDFAYMKKPVLYTQFDRERFFQGEHVIVKGYFDDERDGFGEVATDYETTVNLLCEYMENGCQMKDFYKNRVDSFFAFTDKNNCQRILDKTLEIK